MWGPIYVDYLNFTVSWGHNFMFSITPTKEDIWLNYPNLLIRAGCKFMDERYPRIPQKLMEPPQNLKIPPYFGIYLSLLWIFWALCRSPHLSPPVLSSVCLGIAASFSKHHNYNAHVVAAPINVTTLSSSVYQLGVVF